METIVQSWEFERSDFDCTLKPSMLGTVHDLAYAVFTCCGYVERFTIVEGEQGRVEIITPCFDVPVSARALIKMSVTPGITLIYTNTGERKLEIDSCYSASL